MAPLIALSGFMGSGKSTVGKGLATRLGAAFVDLDEAVEQRLGTSIASFFETQGEEAFRRLESEVLADLLVFDTADGLVLALGGGTLDDASNRLAVRQRFTVVNLKVDIDEAWERVSGSSRPLAQDRNVFTELAIRRRSVYEESADWVIPNDHRDVDSIVDELEALVLEGNHRTPRRWARRLAGTARDSMIIGGTDALHVLSSRAEVLRKSGGRLRVITDENVLHAQGSRLLECLGLGDRSDTCVIAPGEKSKSGSVLQLCWDWLAERQTTRDDVVVAFGGGVVGDLAGFAAATYHRGIGLWQVPTSLLAQVDSSVGGKTAINLPAGKNLVGAFHQPDLVVVDPVTLTTLPDGEFTAALGEVVKHSLLDSEDAISSLEDSLDKVVLRDPEVLARLAKQNIWYKASVVEEDEKEAGRRAVLNLGHTTAHALESVLGYGYLSHGQAVALGLLVALAASEEHLGLSPALRSRTTSLLEGLGLNVKVAVPDIDSLVDATGRDKKRRSEGSGFVGLRAIGEPVWGMDISRDALRHAIEVIAA